MLKLYFQTAENSLFPQSDLPQIISLSRVSDNPNWFYDMHKHDNYCELMFIESGQGNYTLNNIPYTVKTGDVIVLNKNVVHAEASDPNYPLTVWTCSVGNIHLRDMEDNTIIPKNMVPVIPSGELQDAFLHCFQGIYQERTAQRPEFEAMVQMYVCQLLILVQRLAQEAPQYLLHGRGKLLSESIKQYIDMHYAEEISLSKLSNIFHVSTYHIAHEVKRDMGISPINYLIGRRIGEAQRLLTSTDMTVAAISQAVGYANTSYFMKLFQRRVGMTPTHFKEMYILDKQKDTK